MNATISAAQSYNVPAPQLVTAVTESVGRYRVTLAATRAALDAALSLRFRVFNLELNEGLEASYKTGRDEDGFDAHCHHLIVEDLEGQEIVGTYRLQSRTMARAGSGFYSAAEFAIDELGNEILDHAIELGRACIDEQHRNTRVLFLLWRGLATYMQASGNRYFFGCCSLTSQSPAEGVAMFATLRAGDAIDPTHLVGVQPAYACVPTGAAPVDSPEIPKLMGLYLTYGARIVSGPALDREFGTIDFLALFDLESLRPAHRKLFLEPRKA